jgi:RHS repeat-associated protein
VLGVYDSNGAPLSESAIGNRFLWQGREYSWNTGLYYFRARWYDPVVGRWLSNHPIGISGGLNQYVFVDNCPTSFKDPSGEGKVGIAVRIGKSGLKLLKKAISRDEAKRLYRKEGQDVFASKQQIRKWGKEKGVKQVEPEAHGEGYLHGHPPRRTGGHGFIAGLTGVALFGDNCFGEAVDLLNPISDLVDIDDFLSQSPYDENCPDKNAKQESMLPSNNIEAYVEESLCPGPGN